MIAVTVAGTGFITARSSLGADLSLLAELVAVVLLTVGVIFAVRHDYRAHRAFQTAACASARSRLSLWMVRPSGRTSSPTCPATSATPVNSCHGPYSHRLIGVVFGLFVMIRANQRRRRRQSLSRHMAPMRVAYVVYLLGTALGVWLYIAMYG